MIITPGMDARGLFMSSWQNARTRYGSASSRIVCACWSGGERRSVVITCCTQAAVAIRTLERHVDQLGGHMLAAVRALAHKALRHMGYDLINVRTSRPVHVGSERV